MAATNSKTVLIEVDIDRIHRDPAQPRTHFDEAALDELARSIRKQGVVQPVVVRPHPEIEGDYMLLAGERRWRAAQDAGLYEIPAIVREANDAEAMAIALIENIQREDLNPIEEARGFRRMIDEHGLTHEELGMIVGKGRVYVTNALRLLQLDEEVQTLIERGIERQGLAGGHGKILAGVSNRGQQVTLARRAAREGWTVRRLEEAIRKLKTPAAGRSGKDPNIRDYEERLGERLGAPVEVLWDAKGQKGEVRIRFFGLDTLEGLDEALERLFEEAR